MLLDKSHSAGVVTRQQFTDFSSQYVLTGTSLLGHSASHDDVITRFGL